MWHTLAWAVFGAAYVGAIVFVATRPTSTPGDVLLALAAGSRLSAYIGATVGAIGLLRGVWMHGSQRLAWLEDYAASLTVTADRAVPAVVHDGIRFDHVSFSYPGTSRLVLDDVSLALPAGAVVAIVGAHATYHEQYDAPLQSDIEGVARNVSGWYRASTSSRGPSSSIRVMGE